jgi:hypothetical protein
VSSVEDAGFFLRHLRMMFLMLGPNIERSTWSVDFLVNEDQLVRLIVLVFFVDFL